MVLSGFQKSTELGGKDMKPMKFDFVVFDITKENAQLLWELVVKIVELSGFDITGSVTESELDWLGFTDQDE